VHVVIFFREITFWVAWFPKILKIISKKVEYPPKRFTDPPTQVIFAQLSPKIHLFLFYSCVFISLFALQSQTISIFIHKKESEMERESGWVREKAKIQQQSKLISHLFSITLYSFQYLLLYSVSISLTSCELKIIFCHFIPPRKISFFLYKWVACTRISFLFCIFSFKLFPPRTCVVSFFYRIRMMVVEAERRGGNKCDVA